MNCYLHLDFYFDHLYFPIQITEKYSIMLCYRYIDLGLSSSSKWEVMGCKGEVMGGMRGVMVQVEFHERLVR